MNHKTERLRQCLQQAMQTVTETNRKPNVERAIQESCSLVTALDHCILELQNILELQADRLSSAQTVQPS